MTIIGIYTFGAEFIFVGWFFILPISSVLNAMLPTKFDYRTISIDSNGTIKTAYCDRSFFEQILWDKADDSYRKISLVAYNPGYTFDKYLDDKGKEIRRGKVEVKPKLSVHLGAFEYSVGKNFSQPELWWLGKEISDFLGLELQVIYPTPKAPPEPTCGGGC